MKFVPKEAERWFIVGRDFHNRSQQFAMLDPTAGELIERLL
jgi:hypothetical protein